MTFKTSEEGPALVVFLSGEIDLERSPEARKSLLAAVAKKRPVVVDMSEVSYIDSSGIASLVEALQQAGASQQEFSLAKVGERVGKILRLARLDTVFRITD